jgi:hypothetical protein
MPIAYVQVLGVGKDGNVDVYRFQVTRVRNSQAKATESVKRVSEEISPFVHAVMRESTKLSRFHQSMLCFVPVTEVLAFPPLEELEPTIRVHSLEVYFNALLAQLNTSTGSNASEQVRQLLSELFAPRNAMEVCRISPVRRDSGHDAVGDKNTHCAMASNGKGLKPRKKTSFMRFTSMVFGNGAY